MSRQDALISLTLREDCKMHVDEQGRLSTVGFVILKMMSRSRSYYGKEILFEALFLITSVVKCECMNN